MSKNWIAGAIKHPGALHRALKVGKGKKIPASMLEIHEKDPSSMKKRKTLAKTLGKFHK